MSNPTMSNPTASQVLRLVASWLEAKQHVERDPSVFANWEEHRNRCRPLQLAIEALDPDHLRTLAQAEEDGDVNSPEHKASGITDAVDAPQ